MGCAFTHPFLLDCLPRAVPGSGVPTLTASAAALLLTPRMPRAVDAWDGPEDASCFEPLEQPSPAAAKCPGAVRAALISIAPVLAPRAAVDMAGGHARPDR